MNKIGLIAVDGTRYPNLALMKISAYYKKEGCSTEWAEPMFGEYDRVYASKIFTFSPDDQTPWNCEVVRGGTGYNLHKVLPPEIDRLQPDYSIYPQIDDKTAYGFITRGCPNKCSWCVVPIKEGAVYPYMDIDEITQDGKRPNVVLMDNNILASEYGVEQLVKIADKRYRIDLNQGMSARLVTPEIAEIFARIKWMCSIIRFAADTPRQIAEVENAMMLIDKECERIGKKPRNYLIYTMIGGGVFRKISNGSVTSENSEGFGLLRSLTETSTIRIRSYLSGRKIWRDGLCVGSYTHPATSRTSNLEKDSCVVSILICKENSFQIICRIQKYYITLHHC